MSRCRAIVVGLLVFGVGLASAADTRSVEAQSGQVRAKVYGLNLFAEHCASCHGTSGRGDGPRAEELTVRPRDLTRLAEPNGWLFEAASVTGAIAGSDQPHATGEMPRWGDIFRTEAGDAGAAERLRALTLYLEFIQAKRPRH